MAYLPGYTKAAPLTINHLLVGSGGVSDFRMLTPMTLPEDLAAACAFEDLRDLRFTLADGVTPLYHELVSGSKSAKTLQAWVNVPSILSSSPTTLYAQAGNAAATMPSAADQQATWDGYWNRCHFEDSSGNPADATGLSHGGVAAGTLSYGTASKIGNGLTLSTAMVNLPQFDGGAIAVGVWLKTTATGRGTIIEKWGTADEASFSLYIDGGVITWNTYSSGVYSLSHAAVVNDNAWHHVAAVCDGSLIDLCVDGNVAGAIGGGRAAGNGAVSPTVGAWDAKYNGGWLSGTIDELAISLNPYAMTHYQTEYANQSAPDTFSAWGPLETLSTGGGSVIGSSIIIPSARRLW